MQVFKQFFPLFFFLCALLCILCVGFYPRLSFLLYVAFILQTFALFIYTYDILKIKKQATIKAYYKLNSFLHRYFGHFLLVKILSLCAALIGSISLFFMLIFPSGSEILIFCLLVPCSIYGFKIIFIICKANLSPDFAPALAKKYTAFVGAGIAVLLEVILSGIAPSVLEGSDVQAHYHTLMESYGIAQMHSRFWQEVFGFMLLKKSLLDILYVSVADSYLHFALILLFACGHFAAFVSFTLLCIGSISPIKRLKIQGDNRQGQNLEVLGQPQTHSSQNIAQSRSFRQFFAMVFFLIFVYIAFNISIHLQPLAKHQKLPPLLSERILKDNEQYIQISLQGAQSFIHTNDLPSLQHKLEQNLASFESSLNADIDKTLDEYLAQKEQIINKYSQWYFSVSGEYTRLFYAALGKGEDIAQEQFISLLKTYTPYDLQERLNSLYDKHLLQLKARLEQSFGLFLTHKKPQNARISSIFSLEDINTQLDLLSPRATDGMAALLGASMVGVMILKASGKALAKSSVKIVGKSVAKKSLSSAVGVSGSLLCGAFAPLCAIGFFVASDYAINSVDEVLNEDEFKQEMRKGFDLWELQLKNSLMSYNNELSKQILEKLSLQGDSQAESSSIETKNEHK